LNTLFTGIEIL